MGFFDGFNAKFITGTIASIVGGSKKPTSEPSAYMLKEPEVKKANFLPLIIGGTAVVAILGLFLFKR